MAMEADSVVLPDQVFLHSILRMRGSARIGSKVGLLFLEGFRRDAFRGTVRKTIRGSCKPTESGLIKHLDVGELAATKEPILDIFHYILHFTLGLRVTLAAEDALEVFL